MQAEAWLAARGIGRDRAPTQRQAPIFTEPGPDLEDRIAGATAYARRVSAQAPRSEQRLWEALTRRGYPDVTVEAALERCRSEGTVDDRALAGALVEEGRRKGHATRRIQADLVKRGLPPEIIAGALASFADRDPEAAAFSIAAARAARLRGVDAYTAYRRVVGYLARRGHDEGLARKVARQVVFNDREAQRVAER
ncbi:MAG: regulatory protein RecX [Nitriliruptorales bacterium]